MAPEIFASSTRIDPDVFVSFNGEDTWSKMIGYLVSTLKKKGIRTYGDDIDLGHQIGVPILTDQVKAIKTSRVAIIVFSKNYASSKWCLDELVEIVENKRSFQQTVLPVFYHVHPSDVREQTGSFGEALAEHGKRVGEDKVKMWRAALTDAANLLGFDSTKFGCELELIEEIVKEISQKLGLHLDDSSRDAWSTLASIYRCGPLLSCISRSISYSRPEVSFFRENAFNAEAHLPLSQRWVPPPYMGVAPRR